ncbi:lipoate protein ligase C-terminal domain-containing protein [Pyrodictium occultum]|uniref:lipoate protein ligase C-terminal domain-containing protein n=1 Tax=Pyrodictium occultum TaxID=2309 RepID=UPI0014438559|nr:lipoate protein ligase C-terminal domain-containing protein [Pyrodictium occultum]
MSSVLRSMERVVRPPGGKTLEIALQLDDGCRVSQVSITGDFFVYPPEALEALEDALRGCSSTSCITKAVRQTAERAEALGFTWSQLAAALTRMYDEACSAPSSRQPP